jgi:hypothetical protein
MIFGPKIVCEQCNKKAKESKSLYRRGSRFCSEECIVAWEVANPPPVAKGDEVKLREELAMLLGEAFAESERSYNPTFGVNVGGVEISVNNTRRIGEPVGTFGGIDARHRAEQMQSSRELFQTYVLRAAPILRALGFAREATLIDSTDFQAGRGYQLTSPLKGVLAQLRG